MPLRSILLSSAMLVFLAARSANAEEPAADAPVKVSYYRQIRPIFQANCQGCHQPAKKGGEYVMTDFAGMVQGGESELAAIVPGDPDESYLLDLITPDDGAAEMPKGKAPLAAAEIDLVRRWIAEGAKDDSPPSDAERFDADHPPKYKLPPIVTALDISPDGKLLAVSGYHEVLLHKADGSGLVARLVGLSERIQSVAFSPDGKTLAATGGLPGRMGEVQFWDVATGTLRLSVPVTYDTLYGASFSPDGKLLAVGCGDNTVRAFEVETGKQVLYQGASNDWVLDAVFSVDGVHLVTVGRDRTMKLIEVKTERFIDNITSITPGALKGGLSAVDRHPTKDELLCGGADGSPKTYLMHRTMKRKIGDDYQLIRQYEAMPGRVFAVEYSPDGNFFVAGSSYNNDGEVRVYKVDDGKLVWKHAAGPIYAATYSPDGKTVAAAGFDGKVWLLDAATGTPVKDFLPVPLEEGKE